MSHVIHPTNIGVNQLIDEGDGVTQCLIMIDRNTHDPYIVHLNDEQASNLYYQLQAIRNLTVQAALMDVNAQAITHLRNNVFGDWS